MTEQNVAFKPIIWLFIQQYNSAQDLFVKKKLKEALKDTIKKMTDQKVTMVSEAVMDECKKVGVDAFELLWTQRNILGQDENNKSLLLWEHSTPIGEFFGTLIKCENEDMVTDKIENYSGVCWLMRHEDNMLNERGFRASRPGGWEKIYNQCGIKIIKK